jgi:hypothetical protein
VCWAREEKCWALLGMAIVLETRRRLEGRDSLKRQCRARSGGGARSGQRRTYPLSRSLPRRRRTRRFSVAGPVNIRVLYSCYRTLFLLCTNACSVAGA